VIEVPEELVEAMVRGDELVAIAEMVLPILPRRVTEGPEELRDGRIFFLQADRRTG
jgi:hypothetical protein